LISLGEDLLGPLVEQLGPDLVSSALNLTVKRDGTSANQILSRPVRWFIDDVREIALPNLDQRQAAALKSVASKLGPDLVTGVVGPLIQDLGPELVSGALNLTVKREGTFAS
jgi:hypothetical protein